MADMGKFYCETDAAWEAFCRCPSDSTWERYVEAKSAEDAEQQQAKGDDESAPLNPVS